MLALCVNVISHYKRYLAQCSLKTMKLCRKRPLAANLAVIFLTGDLPKVGKNHCLKTSVDDAYAGLRKILKLCQHITHDIKIKKSSF